MIVASKSARASSTVRPAHNEMGWLLAVAAAFLVVHIVALTISERNSPSRTVAGQAAISELCD